MNSLSILKGLANSLPKFEAAIASSIIDNFDSETKEIKEEIDQYNCNNDDSKLRFSFVNLISKKSLDMRHAIFEGLYFEYSIDRVKLVLKNLSAKEIESSSSSVSCIANSNASLTYGEIEFFSYYDILLRANPKLGDIFTDLGHGTGKATIATALLFGNILSRINGIEIAEYLFDISQTIKSNLQEMINSEPSKIPLFEEHKFTMELCCSDFLDLDSCPIKWIESDIIFANSTCFDDDLMGKISNMAISLKPGARIITLTRPLLIPNYSDYFAIVLQRQYCMSWGAATCYIQIRK